MTQPVQITAPQPIPLTVTPQTEAPLVLATASTKKAISITATPSSPVQVQQRAPIGVNVGSAVPPVLGGGSDKYYVHNQIAAASTWLITHNLGKRPSVVVEDSAGTTGTGNVEYIDDNNLRVVMSAPFSGKAYLNLL